jgi:hypothetical protein
MIGIAEDYDNLAERRTAGGPQRLDSRDQSNQDTTAYLARLARRAVAEGTFGRARQAIKKPLWEERRSKSRTFRSMTRFCS